MTIPPRQAFADFARRQVEPYNRWGSPPEFFPLEWVDDAVTASVSTVFAGLEAHEFPTTMWRFAREMIVNHYVLPVAYAFRLEAFVVHPPNLVAPNAVRQQFRADAANRRIRNRPDARETVQAWIVDVYGRSWLALKYRDTGEIKEAFYPPDVPPAGYVIHGLMSIAVATGQAMYGLPAPGSMSRYN